jgi:hypothetical protein
MVRRLGLLFLLGMVIFPASTAAQDSDDTVVNITAPVETQELFGEVTIMGSAASPGNFASYALEYDNIQDTVLDWNAVQPRVQQQVRDGVLGRWDTNQVPDGEYQLRLRVFLTNGEDREFIVSNLRVRNSAPPPTPTSPALDSAPALTPTPGPSPTSLIEQPPSSNPIAGADVSPEPPAANENTGQPGTEDDTSINTGRIRQAFCTGVYLTFGLFGIMLVYALFRGRLRGYVQRVLWEAEDDLDQHYE